MKSSIIAREPVLTVAFLTTIVTATLSILKAFNVYDVTDEQSQAILTFIAALAPILGFFVRQQVVPMAKVEPLPAPPVRPAPPMAPPAPLVYKQVA